MYHHHQHQGKSVHSSSRMSIPPERHLFLQGGNGPGDSGLVLSTDAKPRLKWTSDLHEHFIEAVNQLGGADKATPKTVMKLMGIPGLTLYHLKSHLQKYRLSKNLHGQANSGSNKIGTGAVVGDRISETNVTHINNLSMGTQTNKGLHIGEALQMQIEVQRRLHEQLEVQRHLQLRIEAQGKYLQSVLEKAQETLGRQNLGSIGLEAAKVQLSELVSKVSTQCLNSAFSELKELQGLCHQQTQTAPPTDCSMDSCLTSCEGSQKEQEIHNTGMGLRPYNGNALLESKDITEGHVLHQTELKWSEDLKDNKMFLSPLGNNAARRNFAAERSTSDLSMTVGLQGENGNASSFSEGRYKDRNDGDSFPEQTNKSLDSVKLPKGDVSQGYRLPYFATKLDLNSHEEIDAASSCKQLDLNGFSWN
ncbi:myb-related protein 2 isoform X2 [Ricinus communis]|uniref:myb-related protein 2 isoform X2 n=1 Tax=Ricinus communis TaxID=3988 RepID=UPI00201AF64E|nr:myb-related protein 2 isoform X2 [Ricinus communis]